MVGKVLAPLKVGRGIRMTQPGGSLVQLAEVSKKLPRPKPRELDVPELPNCFVTCLCKLMLVSVGALGTTGASRCFDDISLFLQPHPPSDIARSLNPPYKWSNMSLMYGAGGIGSSLLVVGACEFLSCHAMPHFNGHHRANDYVRHALHGQRRGIRCKPFIVSKYLLAASSQFYL
jgi:hypothetical protein